MSDADIKKWNGKYCHSEIITEINPDEELIQNAAILPRQGAALDLACGLGKNALFLAQKGLAVTAIDGSDKALNTLRKSAVFHGLDTRIDTVQADLEWSLPDASRYELILVVRYLNRELFRDIERALKPGGVLIYKTFNRNFLKQKPGFNPAYTIESKELAQLFQSLKPLVVKSGGETDEYAVLIARKTG